MSSQAGTQDARLRLPCFPSKLRTFILTDIENEPDDQESLVRYLLYCNEFDTRGLCAVTSAWLPDRTAPETILRVIDAYELVVDNLNQHVHPQAPFPSAQELRGLVSSGAPVYGMSALSLPLSAGARNLVDKLEESPKPLWVISWGGANVLAEALQYIRSNKSPAEEKDLHARLRVYTISDQDDTGDWMRTTFPEVFYICSIHGFGVFDLATWQGISSSNGWGDMSMVSTEWLKKHIQIGPLGAVYPTPLYQMEGDTPTFLYLMQNGLGDPENPALGSWGGRYRAHNVGSRHFADVVDVLELPDGMRKMDNKVTIARWRKHFQSDFASRMLWTITPNFAQGTHPPVPCVNGSRGVDTLILDVKSGDKVILDARESIDPDSPDISNLDFEWYQYKDPTSNHPNGFHVVPSCSIRTLSNGEGSKEAKLQTNESGFLCVKAPMIEVTVPDSKAPGFFDLPALYWLPRTGLDGMRYHMILQISQTNVECPSYRYKRIVLDAGTS